MATNGSVSVSITKWDTLKFSWETASQSIANNTSTVSWKLELSATGSGYISSSADKDYTITVNGTKYTGTNKIGISNNSTKTLVSGSTVIKHNSDGKKSFTYSFTQEINITFSGTKIGSKSGSGSGTLDAIPRKATITAAPNFNDESNPKITYSNPAGSAVSTLQACISFDGSKDDIAYRNISKTGTSYTFNLTSAEREVLRTALKNSKTKSVRFYVKSIIGGTTYTSYLTKTLSITNAMPTLSPNAIDIDTAIVALTGDNNILVKGYSDAICSLNVSLKKGATLKSCKIETADGKRATTAQATFNNVNVAKFIYTATDSRGYTVSKTIMKLFVDYVKLTANVSGSLTTDGVMTIKASGNYYNGSIGKTANTLTLQYRYKINSGSYTAWTALTPTITNNKYSATKTISGLNYKDTHTIQIRAVDKIRTVNSVEKKIKSYPVFDWGEDDFNFNVPVSFPNGGAGIYGTNPEGEFVAALQPCNTNGNCVLGNGQYTKGKGATNIYGTDINLLTKSDLTVNDTENVYSLLGAAKALSNSYELSVSTTKGTNFSSVSATAYLVGGCLRMYITATRSSAANAGDITNETVAKVKINHGGKIASIFAAGFASSTTGAPATFHSSADKDDENNHTITITLCGVGVSDNAWTGYWVMPCVLNLSAFV